MPAVASASPFASIVTAPAPAGRPGVPPCGAPRRICTRRCGSATSSAATRGDGVPSGFAALDAQLPGGGWPRRTLTELLLPHPGVGEIRLLAPSLAAAQRGGRLVMLFDPPAQLSAWALAQLGLDVEQLLVVQTRHARRARAATACGPASRR